MVQFDELSQKNFNLAKEYMVEALVKEGYLTPDQGGEIVSKYAIILTKKTWLGKLASRLFGDGEEDNYKVVVVKII